MWILFAWSAHACSFSCFGPPPALVTPRDGAMDVPVDAVVMVENTRTSLVTVDGEVVSDRPESKPDNWELGVFEVTLEPDTTYLLLDDVTDEEVGRFRTGSTIGSEAELPAVPIAATDRSAKFGLRGRGLTGGCGGLSNHHHLIAEWDLPDTENGLSWEVEVQRSDETVILPFAGPPAEIGWSNGCGASNRWDLGRYEQVDLRLRAVDVTGEPGPWSDPETAGGCGCSSAGSASWWAALLVPLALRRRRRS